MSHASFMRDHAPQEKRELTKRKDSPGFATARVVLPVIRREKVIQGLFGVVRVSSSMPDPVNNLCPRCVFDQDKDQRRNVKNNDQRQRSLDAS
jgi:hypothetical protein